MENIRRHEQKLWLILFQIKSIRARLNFLALQHWFFSTLAILICGAALVFAAAFLLGPLKFLLIALLIVLFGIVGMVRAAQWALRTKVTPARAAALADERAALKGRLSTVLALADSPARSPLWPYLVEDTYGLRETFEPARIEPQWLSRSIFALAAALGIAMLLAPFVMTHRRGLRRMAAPGTPGDITADIGNLDIRPADPALEPNAEIYADEATMRKLQEKLSAEQNGDTGRSGLSRWMDKARNLAGDLQGDLTGQKSMHQPPLRLKLTDRNPDRSNNGSNAGKAGQSSDQNQNKPGGAAGPSSGNVAGNNDQPPQPATSLPGEQADQLARNSQGFPGQPGPDPSQANQNNPDSAFADGSGDGGGTSHGSGSDPEHLFGPPSSQPLGTNSFRITIDAQPSDESSTPGAPAYIPPKIKAPLNANQYPDEPLARAVVPAADQTTIKRVFER